MPDGVDLDYFLCLVSRSELPERSDSLWASVRWGQTAV